ncbi:hypothetical protein PVAP13_8KG323708 [Panicum virgatum]|uniref:Uncharacterized protein n=1 Tax=Panicum virgatum TaxID=38727 RepID=A0A8T0PZR5_PANVG|nr:hypothetical protein PVAP13_8KG323708 [Panicum virgatum]
MLSGHIPTRPLCKGPMRGWGERGHLATSETPLDAAAGHVQGPRRVCVGPRPPLAPPHSIAGDAPRLLKDVDKPPPHHAARCLRAPLDTSTHATRYHLHLRTHPRPPRSLPLGSAAQSPLAAAALIWIGKGCGGGGAEEARG